MRVTPPKKSINEMEAMASTTRGVVCCTLLIVLFCHGSNAVLEDPCANVDCGNGNCTLIGEIEYGCVCDAGYTGQSCTIQIEGETISPCDSNPCRNNGTCIDLSDMVDGEGILECIVAGTCSEEVGFMCTCPDGYTGYICETEVTVSCEELICLNEGVCLQVNQQPMCMCSSGYSGMFCEQELATSCPTEVAAGIKWESIPVGSDLQRHCGNVDLLLSGLMVTRKCLDGGEWGGVDYTGCVLGRSTNPFALFWVVVETEGGVREIKRNREEFTTELNQRVNRSGIEAEVVLGQPISITDTTVAVTFRITYGDSEHTVAQTLVIMRILNGLTDSSDLEQLANYTVLEDGRGHQGFKVSNSCSCMPTDQLFEELCVEVSNNQGPCICLENSECQCVFPFYLPEDDKCSADSDFDGTTDSQDVCVDVYNPSQNIVACEVGEGFDGCLSEPDPVWDITWANTMRGQTDRQPCLGGEALQEVILAERVCGDQGWEEADVSLCENSDFTDRRSQAEAVFSNEDISLEEQLQETSNITADLRRLTDPSMEQTLFPSDLNDTNTIVSNILDLLDESLTSNITEVPQQNLLYIFSNVLDESQLEGWIELQENDEAGSQLLLDNIERYGLYLARALAVEESSVSIGDNVAISFSRSTPGSNSRVRFPESDDDLANTSFSSIPARISIPRELVQERQESDGTVPVTHVIFRNMERALPTQENFTVMSMVLSTQVAMQQARSQSQTLMSNPVELEFSFDSENVTGEYRCAYWNFSEPIGSGSWAFDGVEMISVTTKDGETVVKCRATHLTNFAVLVDVSGSVSGDDPELEALRIVSYIGCAISLACLSITIIFYLTLGKNLIIQVHYFIHFNLAISLFLAYLLFTAGIETARTSTAGCAFVAALLQYLFLSAFCWMLCEGIMLYLMLVLVFSTLSKKWWIFLLIGYLPPIIPVVVGVASRHEEYGVKDDDGNLLFCWLSTENGVIWAFVGPMLLIIMVNVFFLVVALVKVYKTTRSKSVRMSRSNTPIADVKLFKTLFKATVVLLPILGLTWVFGLLTVNRNLTVFAWLFTIFNSLQGVFILFFHVLRNEKVWQNSRAKHFRSKATSTFRTTIKSSTSWSSSATFRKQATSSYMLPQAFEDSGVTKVTMKYKSQTEGTELSSITSSAWEANSPMEEDKDTQPERSVDISTAEQGGGASPAVIEVGAADNGDNSPLASVDDN